MILYIFNNNFPDNAGFSKRCKKEIEFLSRNEEVVVLCKRKNDQEKKEVMTIGTKKILIYRFSTVLQSNKKITNYKNKKGIYELVRNLDLTIGMVKELFAIHWSNRKERIKLYTVVSPLTVPLIAYIIGKLFMASPLVVEFHDLEPELAMHIKNIDKNSFITRVEFLLEKVACNIYKKIIVTTDTQAERIIKRTGINKNKILVIPNSIQVDTIKNNNIRPKNKKLTIGYISSFTFHYSISVLKDLMKIIAKNKDDYINTEFIIVGDGSLLPELKDLAKELKITDIFTFLGRVKDIGTILASLNVTIIPWEETDMTQTMAPTKLFEYMEAKKPIIAPNFGEFSTILMNKSEALLYRTIEELVRNIRLLQKDKYLHTFLGGNAYNKYIECYYQEIFSNKLVNFINK